MQDDDKRSNFTIKMTNNMTKNVLKAWLVDNTVTADDKTDKIFQLEMTRSIDKEIILERMEAKNPGVRRETMALGIELYEEVIAEALMNGESVNTGLFRGVAQFRGTSKNDTWDPATNSIYVSLTQGKALRAAIRNTTVDVLGMRPSKFYIGSGLDASTRATDFSATAGRNYTLYGKNLTVTGSDPSVGVKLTAADGTETKLTEDMIVINEPSRLVILIPADLEDGEYTLTVTTQYGSSGASLLKTPRSTSQTLYIGTTPSSGGGTTEPGGDSEDDGQSGSPL